MKNVYIASLCRQGILGGLLHVHDTEIIYCTNKLTVPEKIRRLHMRYADIRRVEKAPLHTVSVEMKDGERYRFLIFARKRFLRQVQEKL